MKLSSLENVESSPELGNSPVVKRKKLIVSATEGPEDLDVLCPRIASTSLARRALAEVDPQMSLRFLANMKPRQLSERFDLDLKTEVEIKVGADSNNDVIFEKVFQRFGGGDATTGKRFFADSVNLDRAAELHRRCANGGTFNFQYSLTDFAAGKHPNLEQGIQAFFLVLCLIELMDVDYHMTKKSWIDGVLLQRGCNWASVANAITNAAKEIFAGEYWNEWKLSIMSFQPHRQIGGPGPGFKSSGKGEGQGDRLMGGQRKFNFVCFMWFLLDPRTPVLGTLRGSVPGKICGSRYNRS